MRTTRSTSPLKRIIFESLIPAQQRHIAMLERDDHHRSGRAVSALGREAGRAKPGRSGRFEETLEGSA